jgi:hypothetical protein
VIDRNRRIWRLLVATSVCTAGMLLMSPLALADDGHGGTGGDDGHDRGRDRAVQVQVFQTRGDANVNQAEDRNDDRDNDNDEQNENNALNNVNVTPLVTAINNEVTTLSTTSLNNDADDAVEANHLQVISLGSLVNGLNATDAAAVTNAVNANTSGLQTFLSGGSANANSIDAALSNAGVSQANVLAIVQTERGVDRLFVITA